MFHFPELLKVAGTCHPCLESIGCPGGRLAQWAACRHPREAAVIDGGSCSAWLQGFIVEVSGKAVIK